MLSSFRTKRAKLNKLWMLRYCTKKVSTWKFYKYGSKSRIMLLFNNTMTKVAKPDKEMNEAIDEKKFLLDKNRLLKSEIGCSE